MYPTPIDPKASAALKSEENTDLLSKLIGKYAELDYSEELAKLEKRAETCPLAQIHVTVTRCLTGEWTLAENKAKLEQFVTDRFEAEIATAHK